MDLTHWDRHWYYWLPRHPRFEAVEVMSAERPGGQPLVWVFFTERTPPKRQHHYINDPRLAAALGWTQKDIRFSTRGGPGDAQGLEASLTDEDGKLVEITMGFEPGTKLSKGGRRGLTSQSGHSGDRHFMVFYRDTQARAPRGEMKIAGVNYAFLPNEPLGSFPARYSNSGNIYIGITGYGRPTVSSGAAVTETRPDGGRTLTYRSRSGVSTAVLDAKGGLLESRRSVGPYAQLTRFAPALPPCRPGATPVVSRFSVSLDIEADLITGQATRRCEGNSSVLELRPQVPNWAAAQPFAVRQSTTAEGGSIFQTTSLQP